jgi:hypothetical protein
VKTDKIEKLFHELKDALESGAIAEEEFQAEIKDLLYQDDEGRYWSIGARTEQWYRYDDGDWVEASPPPTLEPVGSETRPSDMESDQLAQDRKWAPGSCGVVGLVSVLFLVCLVAVGLVSFQLGRMSVMTATAEYTASPTVLATQIRTAQATVSHEAGAPAPVPTQLESSPSPLPTGTREESTPAPTTPPSATPQPTVTSAPTPQMEYGPPILVGPENGAQFGPGYEAVLTWEPVGELREGEYYHVEVCWNGCDGPDDFHGHYLRDTSYVFPSWIYRGRAIDDEYYWHIMVRAQRGEAPDGPTDPTVSPPSATLVFMLLTE